MAEKDDVTAPLPKEWLPRSAVPPEEDTEYWEGRLRRLLAEGAPTLATYRRPPAPSWLEALALRWRPAAAGALALAAASVVALVVSAERRSAPDPRAIALSAIVGDGAPAALWSGAGVPADPTLALLTLEAGTKPKGEIR